MSSRPEGGTPSVPIPQHSPSRLPDYQKTVTMATIAKAVGVSQGAISSLLNDRDYGIRVSEKTRERVFKICRELGYVPNDLRAIVRMYPALGDLCLLVSSEIADIGGDPFQSRVLKGLMAAISEPSHTVTIAHFDPTIDYGGPEHPALPQPLVNGTASKFIVTGRLNRSLFETLAKQKRPAIALGDEIAIPGVVSILPDYAAASQMALECLLGLGHRRIAILSGPFGSSEAHIADLNRGVRAAYDKQKMPIEAQNILYGEMTFKGGFASAELLLDRKPAPTAVFCFNDSLAAGVIACAQTRGIKMPANLSVLGCGDDRCAELIHPSLTTVHIPAEEMGAEALREIEPLVKAAEEGLPDARKILLPVRLVERKSCAPLKA